MCYSFYMTSIIHYTGYREGLVSLLMNLQPQLDTNSDIYIVDSSKDHSGLELATLYGSTRCIILVEVGLFDFKGALNAGFQSTVENKQEGALILSESTVLPATFISNLKKALKLAPDFNVLTPKIIHTPYGRMDSNFQWFNPPTLEVIKVDHKVYGWLTPGCAYITKRTLELDPSKQNDLRVGIFPNETVIVLPYTIPQNTVQ